MSIINDYKQLQMIENIKKIKELELSYKNNLKLCDFQEKQINKLATALEEIEFNVKGYCNGCIDFEPDKRCQYCNYDRILKIIKNVR